MDSLRQLWADGRPVFGGWLSVPSSLTAEVVARVGFDYVCIDNQHGMHDYASTATLVQAILLGGSRPIVRVPWDEPGIIGKVLDAGAQGVIVPMVNTADEAAAVVRACRYAPQGARSYGPLLAGMRDPEYFATANDSVAVIPMIETEEAVANLDEILAVPGIDAVYVGPADLSITLGLPPGNPDDDKSFASALAAVVAACRRAGVVPGIHASSALAPRRLEQGFRMITVSADVVSMRTAMTADLAAVRALDAPGSPSADGYR